MPRRQICYQFSATGTCSYGDTCKFAHTSQDLNAEDIYVDEHAGSDTHTPLREYFENYTEFDYDASQPAWEEFDRLANFFDWSKDEKNEERSRFKDALVKAFNDTYGTDENSLELWQDLCRILRINPLPEGLHACQRAVKSKYVNLVDLVDLPNSEEPLRLFRTEKELSEYTLGNHKVFPRDNIHAGGLLRHLLRRINFPREEARDRRPRRGASRRRI
ncbi:hypothetical protein H0H92_000346 [Tricholoma furcatifolium]|nr:hypothetical protein H0H92_000346 [Tricholoma furcatifolium]